MAPRIRTILALVTFVGLGLPGEVAHAQVRDAFGVGVLRSPGQLDTSAAGTFSRYSYGLGNMRRGGGMLGQSASGASFALQRTRGASRAGGGASAMPTARMMYRYSGVTLRVTGIPNALRRRIAALTSEEALTGLALADRLGVATVELVDDKPLSSFAPPAEDETYYAVYMRQGEEALHAALYAKALAQFKLANDVARQSPESYLSQSHASFAMGMYSTMAFDLRMAIKYFPELPLANIDLPAFFKNEQTPAAFAAMRAKLVQAIEKYPDDPPLHFSLAYVDWFGGRRAEAVASLEKAAKLPASPGLMDAILTFRDGCKEVLAAGEEPGATPDDPDTP